ncbi:MAG: hypothetical protein Q4G33_06035 [bacterium]|nr:hypothetical protein [bacterium]
MAYKHGVYTGETATAYPVSDNAVMVQLAIGTAPVHMLAEPMAAVNKPVLCSSMADCVANIGYSEDFDSYTLCQTMYMNFMKMQTGPVAFINVLDPAKHKKTVEAQSYTVSNKTVIIKAAVIMSTLSISNGSTKVTEYSAEWTETDKLLITFTGENAPSTVSISYDEVDPSAVTEKDIVGAYEAETETRTGAELINAVYPRLGVIPFIITAPKWSKSDTVGAVLAEKMKAINTSFKGMAILDIDSSAAKTRAAARTLKSERAFNEHSIAVFPMVRIDEKAIYLSTLIASVIINNARSTGGVACTSPSNVRVNIDDVILEDGTSVFYDTDEGNELNEAGIVTVIARNGWYTWGNNTAAYPSNTDPKDRWIMTKLAFAYIENDFIVSNFSRIDKALNGKFVEDCVTDENIKLAGYAAAGYIVGGSMTYSRSDNPENEVLAGHFVCRTSLAANVPGETITNIFSFDTELLMNSILGGGNE